MGLSVLGFSVPVFVIGYVLIYLVAIQLGWLPVQGYQRLADGFAGFIQRLILPSIALAIIYVALIARITRTASWKCSTPTMCARPAPKGSATSPCSSATSCATRPSRS